jgi:hypothetical protein
MNRREIRCRLVTGFRLAAIVVACGMAGSLARATPVQQAAAPAPASRTLGTIKSISGNSLVIRADRDGEVEATLSPTTRIIRVAPGQKDLSNAVPLKITDLQVGDRVLVRGDLASEAKAITAVSVIVMKESDLTARHEQEREDWQRRGVGGLVTVVDVPGGTITISGAGIGPAAKSIVVHTTSQTVLRRYAPNSVKFDDAKAAPLDQIKVGDQLRARGERNADGTEITADEVVSGTFRNIAGLVSAVDASAGTVLVQDAITKKPVTVRISRDSSVKRLPEEVAQRIAMRLKGGGNGGRSGGAYPGSASHPQSQAAGWRGPNGGPAGERSGPPDLQRFLSRLPDSSLTDLHKGDAVMIVSTEGDNSEAVTAITLLAGVEPILTAAPSGSTILSPWSLGSANAEAAAP